MNLLGSSLFSCLLLACPVFLQNSSTTPIPAEQFSRRLVAAAVERTHHTVRYVRSTFVFHTRAETFPLIPESALTRSSEPTERWASICKKRSTKTCVQNFAAYPNQRRWLLGHPDSEHRPPARPQLDGLLPAQRRGTSHHQPGAGLCPRRSCHMGLGRQRAAHRNCC